jgi:hypothetical protein
VNAVADRQRVDVDVDVAWDGRRIDAHVDDVHRFLENTARVAHAIGSADEAQRDADGDLLARDQLLKVEMDDVAANGMPLNLADERFRNARALDVQLDDRAARRELAEQPLDFTAIDGEGLRRAAVPIDDSGDLSGLTQLARDAGSGFRARTRAE